MVRLLSRINLQPNPLILAIDVFAPLNISGYFFLCSQHFSNSSTDKLPSGMVVLAAVSVVQRKPRHLFFPAHKATKLFTTHDAIKHITPKHSKAINLEGYYIFFWQETSRRSSSAGHGTVKPPSSCLEFPPSFPPLSWSSSPPPASLEPGHPRQHPLALS